MARENKNSGKERIIKEQTFIHSIQSSSFNFVHVLFIVYWFIPIYTEYFFRWSIFFRIKEEKSSKKNVGKYQQISTRLISIEQMLRSIAIKR